MTDVYWFEQSAASVPDGEAWLSSVEANRLRAIRFPKRRADWLLGRWTAKNAVALHLGIPAQLHELSQIEIRSAPSGAPEVFLGNEPASVAISLSHRARVGACALAPSGVLLGCDLEIVEPHGDAFAADYFTTEELALVSDLAEPHRLVLLCLLWSAKESALKALQVGLRLDTRNLTVSFPRRFEGPTKNQADPAQDSALGIRASSQRNDWSPLQVCTSCHQVFHGWWSQTGDLLRTVLAIPSSNLPVTLAHERALTR